MTSKIQRALISVSDKTGIENFARALSQFGVEILSTGGTYAALEKAGVPVRETFQNGWSKPFQPDTLWLLRYSGGLIDDEQ